MGHGPGVSAAQPEHQLLLVRAAGRPGHHVPARQLAPVDRVVVCRQPALVQPPHPDPVPQAGAVLPRPDGKRVAVEAPHDHLLRRRQGPLPPPGEHHADVWPRGAPGHAEGLQLHRLRRALVHRPPSRCHRVAGSRAQRRRPRVLYPPHEDHGKGDGGVADAGAPEADRRRPRGLLGRRQEAFCPQAVLPVREPALVGPPQPAAEQARPPDQSRGNPHAQAASYPSRPISPPVSAGAGDGKSDSPGAPSLVLMPPDGQGPGLSPDAAMPSSQPAWNPARIFEQWNTSFGSPAQAEPATAAQTSSLDMAPPTDGSEISAMPAAPGVEETLAGAGAQQLSAPAFSAPAPMVNFITPAMWQESVASVYEEGLKRSWDYDAMQAMKRP